MRGLQKVFRWQPHDRRRSQTQFVLLAESALSGALVHIPSDIYDLDPDWEIDPASLIILEKLGVLWLLAHVVARYLNLVLRSCVFSGFSAV